MIRDPRFLISQRPYAVDLTSLRFTLREAMPGSGRVFYDCRIDAVWFRRRKGTTVACIGTLWDLQDDRPADAVQFLERHADGRYGGDCDGRWDGQRYWGAQEPDVIERHLALLRPMLDGYPAIPDGYDGWWRF
ncbi:hypothetical protein [Sphaerisporangium aureirubrum]|uniref:Uncharacterized protein n=1 Tax=Sphaerisporangium aureirubrum TaxID=1544736 RepID=A0ABW1NDI9_9ACTN